MRSDRAGGRVWTTRRLVESAAGQNSSRLVFVLVMTQIRPVIPLTVVPITAATRLRDNNQYWCQSALDPYPAPTFPRRSGVYRFSSRLPEFGDQCSQRGGKEQRRVVAKTLLVLFLLDATRSPSHVFFKNFYPRPDWREMSAHVGFFSIYRCLMNQISVTNLEYFPPKSTPACDRDDDNLEQNICQIHPPTKQSWKKEASERERF